MYQKIIVPIDHGNRNLKTEQHVFTSGILESDCKPVLGEFLQYNGRYYTLSEQRIPYMRDKSSDERFFILTLFGIVMEAERQRISSENTILQVELPVGLPPKHYGALHRKFRDYFMNRGRQCLIYKGREYQLEIADAAVFPQDYAAAMTIYPKISSFSKVTTVDIGGFTLDYLLLRGGRPDLSVCDSLEKGVITLYNTIISRVNSEYDILLEDADIDSIIKGEKTDYDMQVIRMVQEMTKTYVDDLLGTLRERGLDLKTGCVVFIGGRNLKLHETRVYSVTAQQADGKSTTGITTYYNAYHSGVKPWKVRLNDNYAYGGTGLSESYSMASSGRVYADRYHYLVEYDRGLSLGVKPQSNFENAYLFAAGTAKGCGSIDTSGLVLTQQKQGGSITNNTSYDFPYLVCVSDDTVMVFSDVKAGETITIDGKSKKPLLSQQISYFDDVYSVLSQDNMNGNTYSYKHKDMAAALYLGLCQIRRQNDVSGTVVVEGVTADYGKTIESRCSEISFGCLYTIAGQEVSHASN